MTGKRCANPFSLSVEAPVQDPRLEGALRALVALPTADRLFHVADAMRAPVAMGDVELARLTGIDPWFMAQIRRIVDFERHGCDTPEDLAEGKRLGFSDRELGGAEYVRAWRESTGLVPTFARVDTCAAERGAETPYLYATYGDDPDACEARPTGRAKGIILGGGPNRIGQGIEFDCCCVHACFALRELGVETIMVNCNPETVSTDYDTADRLYFEPLTLEHVLAVCDVERRAGDLRGVMVQLGGQTPLKLAAGLAKAGVPLLGTSADAIDRAEDRGRFDALLEKLGLLRPRGAAAYGIDDALSIAERVGYPVLVRPSYVLGGRAMAVCRGPGDLRAFARLALGAAENGGAPSILVDELLQGAIEVDVDCVADGARVVIGGVIEHIEEAGIHSGDSAGVIPPHSLSDDVVQELERQTEQLALELGVVGLMNVQFAVTPDQRVRVLEVNPRASRTVPFVSKATDVPLAKIAAKVMMGLSLDDLGVRKGPARSAPRGFAIKESVFPIANLRGGDQLQGPEMRTTGEVMGHGATLGAAFGKTLLATGYAVPTSGVALFAVGQEGVARAENIARLLVAAGLSIAALPEIAEAFLSAGVAVTALAPRSAEAAVHAREVALVVSTENDADGRALRCATLAANVPYFTTLSAASAAAHAIAIASDTRDPFFLGDVISLQERREAPPHEDLRDVHAAGR